MEEVTTGLRDKGMDRQIRMEKKKEIINILETERCENIDILYITKLNYKYYFLLLLFLYGHVRRMDEERKAPSKNFGTVSTWEKKKKKTSKFVDAGSYNRNEREENHLHGR